MTDEERRQNVPYHTAVTQTLFPSLCFVLLATLTFPSLPLGIYSLAFQCLGDYVIKIKQGGNYKNGIV